MDGDYNRTPRISILDVGLRVLGLGFRVSNFQMTTTTTPSKNADFSLLPASVTANDLSMFPVWTQRITRHVRRPGVCQETCICRNVKTPMCRAH